MLRATAHITDNWFLLDAAIPTNGKQPALLAKDLWNLLKQNAEIRGVAKLALSPFDQSLHLGAEIPWDGKALPTEEIRLACEGCEAAWVRFHTAKGHNHTASAVGRLSNGEADGENSNGEPADWQRLCGEAGWELIERPSGRLSAELDVPGGSYQADLERREDGARGLSVQIAVFEALSPLSKASVGLLLLNACGYVRMARAMAKESDQRTAAGFEVVIGSEPTAQQVGWALSALSVACRMCHREVKALRDEAVSQEHLSVRGWSL